MFPINSLFRTPSFNNTDNSNPISALGGLFRKDKKLPMPTAGPMPDMTGMPDAQPQASKPIEMLPQGRSFEMQPSSMPSPTGNEPAALPEMWRRNLPSAQAPVPLSDIRPQAMGQLQAPKPIPRPDVPTLSGRMVAPGSYDAQQRDYMMQGVKRNPDGTIAEGKDGGMKFKRSAKDIALAALAGLGTGGVLGAAANGAAAAISPRTGREINWNAYQKPRALEEEGRAMQQQQLDRQNAIDSLRFQREGIGLDQERAQTELYKAQTERALNPAIRPQPQRQIRLSPMQLPDGSTVLIDMNDPENVGKEFRPFQRPERQSIGDMIRQVNEEQSAVENPTQISLDSYNARGGDQYVFDRLPERIKQVLKTGKAGEYSATAGEIADAQEAYRRAIKAQKDADLEYTQAEDRKKKAKRVVGMLPGTASAGGTRSLRELTSKYFGE